MWKNELLIQGFVSATQGLTELVEFYERLATSKEIFPTQDEEQHQNQKKAVQRTPLICQVGTEQRISARPKNLVRGC